MLSSMLILIDDDSVVQAVVAILLSLLSVKIYSFYHPYAENDDDILAEAAQWELFLVLLAALMIGVDATGDQPDEQWLLGILLITITSFAFVLMAGLLLRILLLSNGTPSEGITNNESVGDEGGEDNDNGNDGVDSSGDSGYSSDEAWKPTVNDIRGSSDAAPPAVKNGMKVKVTPILPTPIADGVDTSSDGGSVSLHADDEDEDEKIVRLFMAACGLEEFSDFLVHEVYCVDAESLLGQEEEDLLEAGMSGQQVHRFHSALKFFGGGDAVLSPEILKASLQDPQKLGELEKYLH